MRLGSTTTLPREINGDGLIVGDYYTDTQHGFLRTADGSITTIDPPGSLETVVDGINSTGEIVGGIYDGKDRYVFLRKPQGTFDNFKVPNAIRTYASGINNIGSVAGTYIDKNNMWHGYLRHSDGSILTFDPPKSMSTAAECLNDSSVVSGYFEHRKHGTVFLRGFVRFP